MRIEVTRVTLPPAPRPAAFAIGARVKPSGYALTGSRQYWLAQGREPAKTRAREAYELRAAMRGTVTAHEQRDPMFAPSLEIRWADGSISRCLDYMVTAATD